MMTREINTTAEKREQKNEELLLFCGFSFLGGCRCLYSLPFFLPSTSLHKLLVTEIISDSGQQFLEVEEERKRSRLRFIRWPQNLDRPSEY